MCEFAKMNKSTRFSVLIHHFINSFQNFYRVAKIFKMVATRNIQVIYKAHPADSKALPDPTVNFSIVHSSIDLQAVVLAPKQLLLRNLYLALDSYTRDSMRDPAIESFMPPIPIGTPVTGYVVSEVVRSSDERFKARDVVMTFSRWEEYTVIDVDCRPHSASGMKHYDTLRVANPRSLEVPLSYYTDLLGVPGATAFVGIHKYAQPLHVPGRGQQTVYISAASGAVGQIVGRYCKALGLRVVGSAGSADKVDFLQQELRFDAAFNYKDYNSVSGFESALKEACPQGIDIYFDGIGGGHQLDAVLLRANEFARVVLCGDLTNHDQPLDNIVMLVYKRIRMEGLFVFDDWVTLQEEFETVFVNLIKEGKLEYPEHVTEGLQNAPRAFVDHLTGTNYKKAVLKVADL